MGTQFGDLTQYLDDSLTLPIGGVEYRVPGPSAEVGLMCQELFAAGAMFNAARLDPTAPPPEAAEGLSSATRRVLLDGDDETNFYAKVLSQPTYDQMLADGVTYLQIKRAGTTAFLWVAVGAQVAENFWRFGVVSFDPLTEAPAATGNRASRRSTSTRTASAARRGSPSGTKSQPTPRKASPAKARPSRGSKS